MLILGTHGNTFVCKHIKSRDLSFIPSLLQALVACPFLDITYLFTVMIVSIKVFPSATKQTVSSVRTKTGHVFTYLSVLSSYDSPWNKEGN